MADDQILVLDAFAQALSAIQGFEVVGLVNDSDHVVPTAERVHPTVTVLNMGMMVCDGLDLAKELHEAVPSCGIAFIAARPTRNLVDKAVEAGALSVVPKHARLTKLVGAVRGVASGCLTIDPELMSEPAEASPALSDREREILSLTAGGASVKEIAQDLYLSAGTVRNLSSAAIKKLNGRNRFDAARIAYERGWL